MKKAERLPKTDGLPLGEIAKRIDGRVLGDKQKLISGFSTLESAAPGEISFYNNPKYREQLENTRASAVVLTEERADDTPINRIIVSGDPRRSTLALLDIFYPRVEVPICGCHPSAVVSGEATISPEAYVGALASVGAKSTVARGAFIGEGSRLGDDVHVGEDAMIYPNVTIYGHCRIGSRSVVHSGAVIGADGFGFIRIGGTPKKLPQVGGVVIGEDVEIGALTAIDRGALGDTVIGDRVKIDNHVQVGHNVRIGQDSILCGKVGVSGSVTIGCRVTIGGHCGINGHVTIADDVIVTGGSSVVRSIKESGKEYAGVIPAMSSSEWWRRVAQFVERKGNSGDKHGKNKN